MTAEQLIFWGIALWCPVAPIVAFQIGRIRGQDDERRRAARRRNL